MRRFILTTMVVLAGIAASAQTIYPSKEGWKTAKPEEMGYSSAKLREVRKAIIENTHATGFCIVVGGKMIFEYGDIEELSYIASCRKSILSMMYGKYVENGKIDLEKTIGELGLDDIEGLTAQEKEATVHDLITARSGVYHPASNPGDDRKNKPERGTYKRGEFFLYNNWDFNAAGAAFEKMTGKNINDAFGEDIAKHIDMQDWNRKKQKKSGSKKLSKYLAYHFHFSTRDMARIGYLMLRNGKWEDRQVISEEWVKRTTSTFSPYEEVSRGKKTRFSYGYMWWIFDEKSPDFKPQYKGAYTASGHMGQRITVIPELDMVVAMKTNSKYGRKTKGKEYLKILDSIVTAQAE